MAVVFSRSAVTWHQIRVDPNGAARRFFPFAKRTSARAGESPFDSLATATLWKRIPGLLAVLALRCSLISDIQTLLCSPIMPTHYFALFATLASAAVQFVVFLRWLHRRMRDDEVNRQFIRDMAGNHLPHIYEALHKIAAKQGILLNLPPNIRFIDFDDARSGQGTDLNSL
jgi:hypothetical protein